jgi:phosphate transport system protein
MFKMLFEVLSQKSLIVQAAQRADEALERSRTLSEAAFAALLDGTQPEQDLYELDRQINDDEITVRRMVLEHLAANPKGDLAAGVGLISTIIDIERVGDYAKNVYEQSERLAEPWPDKDGFRELRALVGDLNSVFRDTALAVHAGDRGLARTAMDRQYELNQACEKLLDQVSEATQFSAREVVVLALTIRFVKRMGAHLSNLASSVVNPFDRIGFRPGEGPAVDITD